MCVRAKLAHVTVHVESTTIANPTSSSALVNLGCYQQKRSSSERGRLLLANGVSATPCGVLGPLLELHNDTHEWQRASIEIDLFPEASHFQCRRCAASVDRHNLQLLGVCAMCPPTRGTIVRRSGWTPIALAPGAWFLPRCSDPQRAMSSLSEHQ